MGLNYLVQFFRLNKVLAIIVLAGTSISCSLNSEDVVEASFNLRFSADTVFFDTIFSEIPSVTKRLKVYNDLNSSVNISSIHIDDPNTPYELTINGIEGTQFEDTRILANDSLLVLLKANIIDRDSLDPYVIENKLIFDKKDSEQEVFIFSWGQDANFIKDSVLACNTTWSKGKPYVVYNHMLVDSLCTLTIEPGTRIFSHIGSNIYIKGIINATGTPEERILFMNDRFDGNYSLYPGQWGGIIFLEGSKGNKVSYTDILNSEIGIWLGTPDDDEEPDLVLENSSIVNASEACLLGFTSDLEMTNCLLTNAGQMVFAGLAGGNYTLNHNTITNYSYGFFKNQPTVYVSMELELNDGTILQAPVKLNLYNNIIWGISPDEIELYDLNSKSFYLTMSNNLLRTTNEFLNQANNILNKDPLFIDPSVFDFQLDTLSPAVDAGLDIGITIDFNGNPRSVPPDIGAFER